MAELTVSRYDAGHGRRGAQFRCDEPGCVLGTVQAQPAVLDRIVALVEVEHAADHAKRLRAEQP